MNTVSNLFDLLDDAWQIHAESIVKLSGGNINETYAVDQNLILQWLNPIFGATVNEDIDALTPVLAQHNIPVPRLIKTRTNTLWCTGERVGAKPGTWRLMNKLPGECLMAIQTIDQLRKLAQTLAHFHSALANSHYVFKHTRGFAHNFDKHWNDLNAAIQTHPQHEVYGQVVSLRSKIENLMRFVDPQNTLVTETKRIIHGDPKTANFLFQQNDISGVIDLDTMTWSSVSCDLGDAVRSWCNAHNENEAPEFQPEFAREAIGLYEECASFLTKEERQKIASAAPCIALELGIRFAKDALCEDYFAFDPNIGHAKHSLLRAQNQVELASQMLQTLPSH